VSNSASETNPHR